MSLEQLALTIVHVVSPFVLFILIIIIKMEATEYQKVAREELIKLVDEHNEEMGSVKRKYARRMNLWHRASYILIRNVDQ